ncbi:MAG TPA: HepT-like ribonuclease domain-containing protein [Thermoplasmata archaeon]|nr:HepT-like ribonuclease domain-containing protein [Thermoplasmata archaeon]HEV2428691.1 HepT-like ribonuclease domain-containing protein [Thermoplasmata archaeon]
MRRNDAEKVRIMIDRAEAMREVVALRPSEYSSNDRPGRLARAALRSYVYEFCDAGNELGKAVRSANPRVDWEEIAEMRYNLAHEYPAVTPEDVLAFAKDRVPRVVGHLRRLRFPRG